jgi:small subunit ribosomal protein S20
LANHKSAIKRAKQSEARRVRNRSRKTRMRNAVKEVNEAISTNSQELAAARLKNAISVIQRTASKGVIHSNTASRKISRLTLRVNAFLASKTA